MSSARKLAANRDNAKNSTGPRSTAGKRRASRNAYRHGLAAASNGLLAVNKNTQALTAQIVADTDESVLAVTRAGEVAEAYSFLLHIRALKRQIIDRYLGAKGAQGMGAVAAPSIKKVIAELFAIERYERRAGARLNTSLKALRPSIKNTVPDRP